MPDFQDNESASPGLLDSARRMVRTVAATLHNRVELLVLELQEESVRFLGFLLLAGVTFLFGGLALMMGIVTVLLAVDAEHRIMAAMLMTLALALAAVGSALALRSKLKTWSAFSGTRAELHKDRKWLQSDHPKV